MTPIRYRQCSLHSCHRHIYRGLFPRRTRSQLVGIFGILDSGIARLPCGWFQSQLHPRDDPWGILALSVKHKESENLEDCHGASHGLTDVTLAFAGGPRTRGRGTRRRKIPILERIFFWCMRPRYSGASWNVHMFLHGHHERV